MESKEKNLRDNVDHLSVMNFPVSSWVALCESERAEIVIVGESSYCSALYVDSSGQLKVASPELSAAEIAPYCSCCTFTFNGVRFGKSYGSSLRYGKIL